MPEPIALVTLAELDAMPRTPGVCAYCSRDTMVYALILFTCRKCVLDDMEAHGEATPKNSAGRNDTQDTRDNPRAAGAASDRGAQPSGQRTITICCYCRKRIYKVRNGEWYHLRNSSTSCNPGAGSDRRATPVEIEV